jgi:hypothetical protein
VISARGSGDAPPSVVRAPPRLCSCIALGEGDRARSLDASWAVVIASECTDWGSCSGALDRDLAARCGSTTH